MSRKADSGLVTLGFALGPHPQVIAVSSLALGAEAPCKAQSYVPTVCHPGLKQQSRGSCFADCWAPAADPGEQELEDEVPEPQHSVHCHRAL